MSGTRLITSITDILRNSNKWKQPILCPELRPLIALTSFLQLLIMLVWYRGLKKRIHSVEWMRKPSKVPMQRWRQRDLVKRDCKLSIWLNGLTKNWKNSRPKRPSPSWTSLTTSRPFWTMPWEKSSIRWQRSVDNRDSCFLSSGTTPSPCSKESLIS